jgi:hypothetical protein
MEMDMICPKDPMPDKISEPGIFYGRVVISQG